MYNDTCLSFTVITLVASVTVTGVRSDTVSAGPAVQAGVGVTVI